MVFKELEIQGFKSFPDKVKISFDTGVTGVVGPNGSGKSNLSDAVRWVLGETSSRQLRAAGKMEDVIFGGTRKRSPMGFAQVRLTLDNTAHTLDVDADEVTIGRKYYRSGDSEYTINGQVCRLRDVYELLLDTGIGRDGYSVIGQGRIAEIVAAKSSERREIFEEACGIAKYRYRKTEAERRLAAAGENLERLRDILGELESRVGPLEKESAKAQKFLELSARCKNVRLHILGGVDDQEYADECYALVEQLGMKNVIFTGRVNIMEYFTKLDFTILTSISEGQPLSVLESFAAQRPAVTTDVGCCRALINGEEGDLLGAAGYCVLPMYREGLADAMEKMCSNRARMLEMGRIGQKRVELYYQQQFMLKNYQAVYDELREYHGRNRI